MAHESVADALTATIYSTERARPAGTSIRRQVLLHENPPSGYVKVKVAEAMSPLVSVALTV
jgi:hypothetical protein